MSTDLLLPLSLEKDVITLLKGFKALPLNNMEIIFWLQKNFIAGHVLQNVIETFKQNDMILKEKYYCQSSTKLTFYFIFYNKRTKSRLSRNICVIYKK